MQRYYIGLANTHHDSAMSIVNADGKILFAEATERYLQYKRAMNISPDMFMRTAEVVKEVCGSRGEIVVATSWSERAADQLNRFWKLPIANLRRSTHPTVPAAALRSAASSRYFVISQVKSIASPGYSLEHELSQIGDGDSLTLVGTKQFEHHLTHAATACFTSPFSEAVCAILDGYGEGKSWGIYSYKDGALTEIDTGLTGPSLTSLGRFYTDVCDACGFNSLSGEEWKVMGLASYGVADPSILKTLRAMIHVNGLRLESNPAELPRLRQELFAMRRDSGDSPLTAANLAASGQQVFEEILFALLRNVRALGISDNLVFGGGCALNSSANGKIVAQTQFKNVYVPSAPADDGNAIGAALLAYKEDHPDYRPSANFQSPYLGSSLRDETLRHVQEFSGIDKLFRCDADAPERAATLLSQGKIIGWIQGRAEFGPRALGNRSILADPRRADIKEVLNARVKFREEFRPFAPSILHEYGPQYFEEYCESPYMERTLKFRDEVRHLVPGAIHHDGTGRLQTVKADWNKSYYRLLRRFLDLTSIPLVINTSFNVMGKPIAHSVEDAIAVFYTSGLDALFIDNVLIEK